MSSDEKIELTKEELKELIDRRVEEKLDEKSSESEDVEDKFGEKNNGMSRRGFLRKLGVGAVGLGALGFSPVSGLSIKDSRGLSVFSDGSQYLDVSGDPVRVLNADMSVKGNNVVHAGNLGSFNVSNFSGGSGGSGQFLKTDGSSLSWDSVHDAPSGGTNISVDGGNTISVVQGSGSGLDADTVDGTEAADLGGSGDQLGWNRNRIISFSTTSSISTVSTTGPQRTDIRARRGEFYFFAQNIGSPANYSFQGKIKRNGGTVISLSSATSTSSYYAGSPISDTIYKYYGYKEGFTSAELTSNDTITESLKATGYAVKRASGFFSIFE